MSQIYKAVSSSPSVPTTFDGDTGSATPAANVINIVTDTPLSTSSDNGIMTTGSGNSITIQLTNLLTGTGSVTGAGTGDLITFDLGGSATVYRFTFKVTGRDTATGDGVGYTIFASARTDGATATLIATQFSDADEDASLSGAQMDVVVSGNDVILQATGVAGQTITYNSTGEYVSV